MWRAVTLWALGVMVAGLTTSASAQQSPPSSLACRRACGAYAEPQPPNLLQCVAQCVQQRRERQRGARAATPHAPVPPQPTSPQPIHGAVYLAQPPNMSYGMVVGQTDRLSAHRLAEIACRSSGANCIMVQDFTVPCAAIAEGVRRAPGAFFMTSDPKTYRVRAITYGIASNPADAEFMAREACKLREGGGLTCRIVQAACGPR